MRIILLFLDGVGIGENDPETNPMFRANLPGLRSLLGGRLPHREDKSIDGKLTTCFPVNATLGVAGLPQSGTGQTAIFTGVNGAKIFGRHFGPFPPSALKPILQTKNIFRQLKDRGRSVVFANAFPRRFFEYTQSATRRLTVTTLSCMMADVPLLDAEALKRNEGISAELTREKWADLGHSDIKAITAREAGHHLNEIAQRHDFTLFEYWLTDHAGHSREMEFAVRTLEHLDEFVSGLAEEFDYDKTLMVIISDHGNIEDLSTKSHTRNQVPCIVTGKHRDKVRTRVKNLTHITPTILSLFDQER